MTKNLLTIMNDNDWDDLAVEITNNDATIHEDFHHEKIFLQFIEDNIDKFEAKFDGYEIIDNTKTNKETLLFKFSFDKEKRLSSEYVRSLGDDIMINLTDAEVEEIKQTEEAIRSKFMKVLTIDTRGVEPKYYPFDVAHSYLREDDDSSINSQKEVLDNAPTTEGDYITIVKVVK